jgi:hypothetical protein
LRRKDLTASEPIHKRLKTANPVTRNGCMPATGKPVGDRPALEPIRQAIATMPAMVGNSQSGGQKARISRSAGPGSTPCRNSR